MADFALSTALLVTLIGIATVIEAIVPFASAHRPAVRLRANLGLLAIFLLLTLALNIGSLLLLASLQTRTHWLVGALPPVWGIVVSIVLLDFFTWLAHWSMHKTPRLWRAHRIHHSDTHVDATTAFRQHPVETMIRFAFTIGPALLFGVPAAALAIYRLISAVNAVLEHSNIRVWQPLDGWLSAIFVTPNTHKVHHSRQRGETDSNYGNILTIYDRIFGTFTPSARAAQVRYGLDEHAEDLALGRLLQLGFRR